MSVREGQRWKRDIEDGEIILIEQVWQDEAKVQARPVEPPCAFEPFFWATPEYIEARYSLLSP